MVVCRGRDERDEDHSEKDSALVLFKASPNTFTCTLLCWGLDLPWDYTFSNTFAHEPCWPLYLDTLRLSGGALTIPNMRHGPLPHSRVTQHHFIGAPLWYLYWAAEFRPEIQTEIECLQQEPHLRQMHGGTLQSCRRQTPDLDLICFSAFLLCFRALRVYLRSETHPTEEPIRSPYWMRKSKSGAHV